MGTVHDWRLYYRTDKLASVLGWIELEPTATGCTAQDTISDQGTYALYKCIDSLYAETAGSTLETATRQRPYAEESAQQNPINKRFNVARDKCTTRANKAITTTKGEAKQSSSRRRTNGSCCS